jgi:hypothetical protein
METTEERAAIRTICAEAIQAYERLHALAERVLEGIAARRSLGENAVDGEVELRAVVAIGRLRR